MGALLLILTTFIWGTAFLAQKFAVDSLGPFAMTSLRNLLGGGFLLLCILFRRRPCSRVRFSILAGICCGLPLFAAMLTQQIGIEHTTPGISAFLTTNYVLFVPLIVALMHRALPSRNVIIGAAMALVGTYCICISGETMTLGRGEAWTILCALLFSIQMIVIDRVASECDLLVMSAAQLFTCFLVGTPFYFIPSEFSKLAAYSFSFSSLWPLLYCGILSSGVAYTLQNFGQARTPASLAAILLSLESVFGALSGYFVLGDRMTFWQLFGCVMVFAAVLISQFSIPRRRS